MRRFIVRPVLGSVDTDISEDKIKMIQKCRDPKVLSKFADDDDRFIRREALKKLQELGYYRIEERR